MQHAVAYINWGRWVADCPSPACTNALEVGQGQDTWQCGYWVGPRPEDVVPGCGITAPLDWPKNPQTLLARLSHLPESQRHWVGTKQQGEAP